MKKIESDINNFSVLSYNEINSLICLYKNDGFEKVNGAYNESQEGEPDIECLPYDSAPDEDGDYSSDENSDELK